MDLQTPDPDKVAALDYEFTYRDGKVGFSTTVWPSLGDSVETGTDETGLAVIRFNFPRFGEIHTIYRSHVLAMMFRQSLRVYVDPMKVRERMKTQQESERTHAPHGKTQAQTSIH